MQSVLRSNKHKYSHLVGSILENCLSFHSCHFVKIHFLNKLLHAYVRCVYIAKLNYQIDESKIVSEYDQEIPQSQTADNPVAPRGRAAQPSRATRKTNQAKQSALSSPSR